MGEIRNAQIIDASIYTPNGNYLTFKVTIKSNEHICDVGHYDLGGVTEGIDPNVQIHPKAVLCIAKIMQIAGVTRWEDLKGKYIRYEDNGINCSIERIGHIIDDAWFDIYREMGSSSFTADPDAYIRPIND